MQRNDLRFWFCDGGSVLGDEALKGAKFAMLSTVTRPNAVSTIGLPMLHTAEVASDGTDCSWKGEKHSPDRKVSLCLDPFDTQCNR